MSISEPITTEAVPPKPKHGHANPFDYLAEARWIPFAFYEATYYLSMLMMILGFSLRIKGTRNVPKTGPVLFIANHQSFLDPILVGLAARRHLAYVARKTLFDHAAFAWLIRMLNAVPIDQEGVGIEGLRTTVQLLQAGQAVVVFPEGNRTEDGKLQPLQPGISLLIKRTQAVVVPVGLAGAYHAWPRWQKLPMPSPLFLPPSERTLAVVVGEPLDARQLIDLPRPQMLGELLAQIQRVQEQAERTRRRAIA
jgi:1-acyl-sn-glycerol-3-phosphate acyltransferase